MTTIDTSVKGTYRIENDRGELLAEVDNAITDLGMQFLAGHPIPVGLNSLVSEMFFQKRMINYLVAETSSGTTVDIFSYSIPKLFSSKIIPRTDGLLQINTTFKATCAFGSTTTIVKLYSSQNSTANAASSVATLPSPGLTFQTGEAVTISYTLQYVTDCNRIIQNMPFTASGSSAINMPPNRTNVRNSPLVIYPEAGTTNEVTNPWRTEGDFRACLDFPDRTVGTVVDYQYPGLNLFFYSDVNIYDSLGLANASTTSTLLKQPAGVYQSTNSTPTYIYKKRVSSVLYSSSGNTWSTSFRFLFEPGEWPITATGFSFLHGYSTNTMPKLSERANAGIFTALQTPYNPYRTSANMVVGIDYKFNWTRG